MMGLKKKIRILSDERRLARDAQKAIRIASKTYWAQLSLDEQLRDNDLMNECLSVMRCASSVLCDKVTVSHSKLFSCSSFVRRAITVLASLFLVIALSTGIAYAAGFNVWNIIFHSGNGYTSIQGHRNPNSTDVPSPFSSVKPTEGFVDFVSAYAGCQAFSISPVLIPNTSDLNIKEVRAYGTASEVAITLIVDYTCDGLGQLSYMAVMYPDANTAFTLTAVGVSGDGRIERMNGVDFYIVEEGEDIVVMWCEGLYSYQITTDIAFEALMGALTELY